MSRNSKQREGLLGLLFCAAVGMLVKKTYLMLPHTRHGGCVVQCLAPSSPIVPVFGGWVFIRRSHGFSRGLAFGVLYIGSAGFSRGTTVR
jgi:hypothetical protein